MKSKSSSKNKKKIKIILILFLFTIIGIIIGSISTFFITKAHFNNFTQQENIQTAEVDSLDVLVVNDYGTFSKNVSGNDLNQKIEISINNGNNFSINSIIVDKIELFSLYLISSIEIAINFKIDFNKYFSSRAIVSIDSTNQNLTESNTLTLKNVNIFLGKLQFDQTNNNYSCESSFYCTIAN